jgi:hypothetical protein
VISGGTGTGNTTLLRILADFIPDRERIVVIEDTSELQIQKPNILVVDPIFSPNVPAPPLHKNPRGLTSNGFRRPQSASEDQDRWADKTQMPSSRQPIH